MRAACKACGALWAARGCSSAPVISLESTRRRRSGLFASRRLNIRLRYFVLYLAFTPPLCLQLGRCSWLARATFQPLTASVCRQPLEVAHRSTQSCCCLHCTAEHTWRVPASCKEAGHHLCMAPSTSAAAAPTSASATSAWASTSASAKSCRVLSLPSIPHADVSFLCMHDLALVLPFLAFCSRSWRVDCQPSNAGGDITLLYELTMLPDRQLQLTLMLCYTSRRPLSWG